MENTDPKCLLTNFETILTHVWYNDCCNKFKRTKKIILKYLNETGTRRY